MKRHTLVALLALVILIKCEITKLPIREKYEKKMTINPKYLFFKLNYKCFTFNIQNHASNECYVNFFVKK